MYNVIISLIKYFFFCAQCYERILSIPKHFKPHEKLLTEFWYKDVCEWLFGMRYALVCCVDIDDSDEQDAFWHMKPSLNNHGRTKTISYRFHFYIEKYNGF